MLSGTHQKFGNIALLKYLVSRRGARGVVCIKLPIIGGVKTYKILPDNITPKFVTISRKASPCFASFKIETATKILDKLVDVVDVDLGIKLID